MTKNQKIKYLELQILKKKNLSTEELVNEFLVQDSINAIGIAMQDQVVILLYEEI